MLRMKVILLLCLAVASLGVEHAGAQLYGSTEFLIMRRSTTFDRVMQWRTAEEFDRTVDFETMTVVDGDTTTTTETPIRVEEITDTLVGDSRMRSDDISFGHNPAGRVKIGQRFGDFGIESSYLWVEAWRGATSVSDPNGNLVGPFVDSGTLLNRHTYIEHIPSSTVLADDNDPQPAIVHLNSFAEIFHESELQTGDINLTALLTGGGNQSAVLLAGFRYADLSETFSYRSTSVPPPMGITEIVNDPYQRNRTRNRLFGPQLGMVFVSELRPGVALNVSAKTCLAYNRISRDLDWRPDANNDSADVFQQQRTSAASFLGEFGVSGALALSPNLTLTAGYEVMVLSDVALATANFVGDVDALNRGSSTIHANSRAIYGAPVFGAALVY